MARYFLDAGVLVGLTFLHDAWRDEAERLFETDNFLFVNRAVIYDYCVRSRDNRLESATVDWDAEDGVFGKKLSRIRAAQLNLDLWLESQTDADLDLETLLEAFLEESRINENTDDDLIDEYIRPRLRSWLGEQIGDRSVDVELAKEVSDRLCDEIQTGARDTREEIRDRVRVRNVSEEDWKRFEERLEFVHGYVDTVILASMAHLSDIGEMRKIVSTDKNHMYENRDRLKSVVDVVVVYIKDEFAKPKTL